MWELAVIALRLVQYGAASILAGSAPFLAYALPATGPASASARPWPKPLLASSALALTAAALLGLLAQTAVLAGSLSEALKAESLVAVTGMDLGTSAIARAMLACIAAGAVYAMPPGRPLWLTTGALGSLAAATFAWMGHGAATEGGGHLLHLAADGLHSLAAALWIGALAGFLFLLFARNVERDTAALHAALARFSALGTALVVTLVLTGLVNSWFLIGPDVEAAISTGYAQLLALKLALFGAMLILAAIHRYRLVPALGRARGLGALSPASELNALRCSVLVEATAGLGVLAAVAWLGTLEPPALF